MHFRAAPPASTPPTIQVTVRLFAQYAELLGREQVAVSLAAPATVAQAVARLRQQLPQGDRLPEHPLVAVNLRHVGADQPLDDGDEVAVLPPLAGG